MESSLLASKISASSAIRSSHGGRPGTKAVNSLVMVESFDEAAAKLGYSEDFGKYTLCQVMDAF